MKAPEKFCASAPETVATVLLCYYKKYILLYMYIYRIVSFFL